MPALRFKTCRLLSGNVRNRELTTIQRRILRRLRKNKKSIKKNLYPRKKLHSYIQSQTTRKLPLFHGGLPITEMHKGTKRTSYIPFLLNPETRSDVILVRLHFCETLPQARQPISHRKVCVNNGMVSISNLKLSHGDLISFQEKNARIRGEERRRSFYIERLVDKIIGKFRGRQVRMWKKTKIEWFDLLKTLMGCRLLLKSRFLQQLRSSMQESDLERTKKFGSEKVCLGSSFAEHKIFLLLSKRKNEKNLNLPPRTISPIISSAPSSDLTDGNSKDEGPPKPKRNTRGSQRDRYRQPLKLPFSNQFTMKSKIKRVKLPTHYSEVNHRTLKAVVFYGPNIGHIPHDIRLKDLNLPLRSGNGRGQNI